MCLLCNIACRPLALALRDVFELVSKATIIGKHYCVLSTDGSDDESAMDLLAGGERGLV